MVTVGEDVIAYGGVWLMVDEAHVTTFAVHPRYRRRRIGERLLLSLMDLSVDRHAREATLEVRLSNLGARRLYEKYGFRPVGHPAALLQRQPGRRADHDDGAAVRQPMRERIGRLRAALDAAPPPDLRPDAILAPTEPSQAPARPRPEPGRRVSGPLVLAVESSCDETGIAVVEGGTRIHANVVASQVALHAATGGIVPEVAARAHLRWIVPVLDEALADAGATVADLDAVAVTSGPGLAGSLLVGINFAKTLAWAHGKPLVGVNHLEGHLYAGWLLDPGEDERDAPPFPLVGLVVSGGHTFLVEMRDHLTYRLLGTTVDDAAGEAFDKVGRLLGLGYPGGPAISAAATRATAHDRVFPRAWMGDSYDFSFSGLKTAAQRIIGEARAEAGIAADDPAAPLPDALLAELAWGFQDAVVDVLATKTLRAAEATASPGDRARRWRGGQRRSPGADRGRCRGARDPGRRSRGRGCARTTAR